MMKLYKYYLWKTYLKRWFKSAKANPKVSAGIIISVVILYILIF